MAQARKLISEIIKRVFTIPEKITVKEWADRHRVLSRESSAEYGKWDTDRTPYMNEIYEKVTDEDVREIALQFGAQLAKSELILNVFGWYAHLDPCPMMLVQPTDTLAAEFSKERVAPMIRDTDVLRGLIKDANKKNSGNTVLHKMFMGGFLAFRGAATPSKLAAKPIRILFMDEIDRYKYSAGTEGDPVELAKKRTQTFWDHKRILTSSPGIKGKSKIEEEYLAGSQGIYYLGCPSCREDNELLFDKLVYQVEKIVESVKMACDKCGALHTEEEWKRNNQETGKWKHKHPEKKEKLSYKLNGLAGVFRSWKSIVEEYLEAQDNEEKMKVFINTVLCETWEETKKEMVQWDEILQRREMYEADLPDGVLLLTAGIDVQDTWFAIEILGHGLKNETWGIQYKVISGNLEEQNVWNELDEFLKKKWYFKDGIGLSVYSACIDTGGHHTERVYDFVKPRQNLRRIFGIKGIGGENIPVINGFRETKNKKIDLLSLGVNALKDITMGRLKIQEPGPGYCHFPKELFKKYDEMYAKALTAEVKEINKNRNKVEWKQVRARNEALDCRNYAIAAKEVFSKLDLEKISKLRKEQLEELSSRGKVGEKTKVKMNLDSKGVEL